jgi:hypothetical protein
MIIPPWYRKFLVPLIKQNLIEYFLLTQANQKESLIKREAVDNHDLLYLN